MEVGSDHLPITIVIMGDSLRSVVRHVQDWKKVDWKVFIATLLRGLGRLPETELKSEEDVHAAMAHLTLGLQYAIDSCVSVKTLCSYSQKGWTPEVKALHIAIIERRRRWVRFWRVAYRERYLHSCGKFKGCWKENMRTSWWELCSSTTSTDYWSLYKKMNHVSGSNRVEALTWGEKTTTVDLEKANMVDGVFFPSLPLATPELQAQEPDSSLRTPALWLFHRQSW